MYLKQIKTEREKVTFAWLKAYVNWASGDENDRISI